MNKAIPCVLMRAGTSRGPFFLREWLPDDDEARDQALIGAIGASARIDVTVRTPGGRVTYDGDARIDGVAGTSA